VVRGGLDFGGNRRQQNSKSRTGEIGKKTFKKLKGFFIKRYFVQAQKFLDHAAKTHDERVMRGEKNPHLFPK